MIYTCTRPRIHILYDYTITCVYDLVCDSNNTLHMHVLGCWFWPCSWDPLQAALHRLCLYSLVSRSGGATKVHPILHHSLRAYMYKRLSDSSYAPYIIYMLIYIGRLTTALPSTSGHAAGWWQNCSSWGLCSQGRARRMRSIRYARYWARRQPRPGQRGWGKQCYFFPSSLLW